MTKRDAMLLADRQRRVVEDLIAKMRRGLDQLTTENKGEERLARILGLVEKAQGMSPSDEQCERMWAIVERARGSDGGAGAVCADAVLGRGGGDAGLEVHGTRLRSVAAPVASSLLLRFNCDILDGFCFAQGGVEMANVIERLCGEYEWSRRLCRARVVGQAPSAALSWVVSRSPITSSITRGTWRTPTTCRCRFELVGDSEYPEFEFDLVAHRAPSWLRWWRSKTVHRMKLGQGFA